MSKNTFDNLNLHKGINSPREAETMADLVFGVTDTDLKVGQLKGWIQCISEKDLEELK